ncbi:EamA family transporter RarD [Tumebacillus sp. ITR2]|uniref:EamA family transporter RarD n=1 Tax=Tumebacillus amylolyticus TaxID=2801339 RepID=A0ABS1JB01_9BACL|nr:EamA family transporter RarD [Tumebacillus amylolyticus]MBL0387443.1 EamA family transporter RarD [Tumebacillus amylolyticus]
MNIGTVCAALSYIIWGLLPIYWKTYTEVGAWEILSHRIIWSVVFVLLLVTVTKKWKLLRESLPDWKSKLAITFSSLLISANWVLYIWAVNNNHMVEASLGYYINPLVNVFLGVFFLGERLTKLQWGSISLAIIGVLIMTISYGQFPWVSISLALSFGLYGLSKKKVKIDTIAGLSLETLIVLPFALIYLLGFEHGGTAFAILPGWKIAVLLLAGVATALPLLLFAEGAKRLPLSVMGFFQYISPTLTLILGLVLYHESFTTMDLISFAFIWSALLLYTVQILKKQKIQSVTYKM